MRTVILATLLVGLSIGGSTRAARPDPARPAPAQPARASGQGPARMNDIQKPEILPKTIGLR